MQKTTSIRIWAAHHTYLQILTGLKNSKKNRGAGDNTCEDELICRLIKMSVLILQLFQICRGIPLKDPRKTNDLEAAFVTRICGSEGSQGSVQR